MDYVEKGLIVVIPYLLLLEAIALARTDRPITGALRRNGRIWALWPWALGMIAGHAWWPWRSVPYGWIPLCVIGLAVLWSSIQHSRERVTFPAWAPITFLLGGILSGGLLWSGGY